MNKYFKEIKIYIPILKFTGDRLKIFFKINYAIFPVLWTLTFFIGLLESFTYAGYSFKHLFLPFQPLMALSLFSGIVSRFTPGIVRYENRNQSPNKIISTVNKLIFIPLLASYILIISLEYQNYHNYVFSTIHLQPQLYFWLVFLSTYLFFINIQTSKKELLVRKMFLINSKEFNLSLHNNRQISLIGKNVFYRILIFVFMVNILMNNLFKITPWMIERLSFMIRHPLASYDEKMNYGLGDFYSYMLFVRNNTPENAVIMYPPMRNPWNDVGNGGLIRYFLYPREIVQNITDVVAEVDSTANYAMLAWGSGVCTLEEGECHGWPRVKIPAEAIIYKQNKTPEVEKTVYNIDYDYNDEMNKGKWGLVKIKKN